VQSLAMSRQGNCTMKFIILANNLSISPEEVEFYTTLSYSQKISYTNNSGSSHTMTKRIPYVMTDGQRNTC
jgi:hypothetical protein